MVIKKFKALMHMLADYIPEMVLALYLSTLLSNYSLYLTVHS
jgi:hypothetical protein